MTEREFLICRMLSSLGSVKGRKRLQKMMYIAKSLGYPVSENYVWGNYGVFSSELQWELDVLVREGAIEEENVSLEGRDPEYLYRLALKGEGLLEQVETLASRREEALEIQIWDNEDPVSSLGNNEIDATISFLRIMNEKSVRDLELWSSILYLGESEKSVDNLVAFLRYLKPHYVESEIRKGIDEVNSLRLSSFETVRARGIRAQ